MAIQFKKVPQGPFTAKDKDEDGALEPGVVFVAGEEQFAIMLSELPEEIVTRLAVHGLSQKVGDSYAGAGDEEDPVAYAKECIADTIAQLRNGEWRVSGTGGGPRATLLARALARATGQDIEAAISVVENLTKEQKAEYGKHPDIVKAKAAIKAEDAQKAAAKAAQQAQKVGAEEEEEKADLSKLFTAEGIAE